jgi:transcriptional regulator with XRE-family HTH domain
MMVGGVLAATNDKAAIASTPVRFSEMLLDSVLVKSYLGGNTAIGRVDMAHEIDIEVGRRVRAARHLRGFTQLELGKKVGVKFQQIQKYETGANRISCSRIVLIAEALNVPATDFLSEIVANSQLPGSEQKKPKELSNLLFDPKTAAILAAFDNLGETQKTTFRSLLFAMVKETK